MTIDIQTGELLGRYLSEERDTGRRLKACYASLLAADGSTTAKAATPRKSSRATNGSKPAKASTASQRHVKGCRARTGPRIQREIVLTVALSDI